MPWQVGIDEAGYGPNLGPLVMTAVACQVPTVEIDLWDALKDSCRRHGEPDDGRHLVADSKLIFSQAKGLFGLESTVLAFLITAEKTPTRDPLSLADLIVSVAEDYLDEMRGEPWFAGTSFLPAALDKDVFLGGGHAWKCGLRWGLVSSVLVGAERFNALIKKWDSKAAVTGMGLIELLRQCLTLPDGDAVDVTVDKQGGRNRYSVLLQTAFEDGFVIAREEGAELSVYDVMGFERPIRIRFMPRADGSAFCVALASMISKYLRELLMAEFNAFWIEKIPGLKPTAGYPGDSTRFYDEIRPTMKKLKIAATRVWRER